MTSARRVTLAVVGCATLLAAVVIGLKVRESATFFDPAILLSRFPVEDAAVFSADVAKLRAAGLLKASTQTPEAEYKQFVEESGFDYRRDLALVAASFSGSGTYIIARGRFDWKKLESYALKHSGNCYQRLCRMPGSKPERRISFLPLRDDTIALAVSTDDLAASKLENTGPKVTAKLPAEPVWLSLPGAFLRNRDFLPLSLRVTLSGLTSADRVVLTASQAARGMELRMNATCRTVDDARVLASQLSSNTAQIREGMAKSAAPPEELVRLLSEGAFAQSGTRVDGRWPLSMAVLESLGSGI